MMSVKLIICIGLLIAMAVGKQVIEKGNDNKIMKLNLTKHEHTLTSSKKYKDCHQWRLAGARNSGVYVIHPNGTYPLKVHCEHGVNMSWTVIQRRINGDINFHTTWYYYKTGFGSYVGDYWAGLDTIYYLTSGGRSKLKIDMQDWKGNNRQASYNHFQVQGEATGFRMYVSGFTGNVIDSLSYHNGMSFATPDKPDPNNCAVYMRAGWWFNYCAYTLLNGNYYRGGAYTPTGFYDGIFWKDWLGFGYSLRLIIMSISH